MFPEPLRPALHLSNHFMLVRGGAVSYTAYTGKTRMQCDECVWCLHEARGVGPLPRSARTKRTVAKRETKSIMFLCTGHTALWRGVDGK